jgi:hypothetical protein
MQYPLEPFKMTDKSKWASHVLDDEDVPINDVFKYHREILRKRGFTEYEVKIFNKELKSLIAKRFSI